MKQYYVIVAVLLMLVAGCDGTNSNCQVYKSSNVAYCKKCGSHCIICMHEGRWSSDPCQPHCGDCGSENIRVMRAIDYYEMKRRREKK
jgi:hypothetical protein